MVITNTKVHSSVDVTDNYNGITVNGPSLPRLQYWQDLNEYLIELDKRARGIYDKEFPELFPDQAWTVTGKTNSDADRATIKNITTYKL